MGKSLLAIGVMSTLVNQKYTTEVKMCDSTWGDLARQELLPVYYFGGYIFPSSDAPYKDRYINLPGVQEDYQSATEKQYYGLRWLYQNVQADYYMIVGTDTYLHIYNLIDLLSFQSENRNENDHYLGGDGDIRYVGGEEVYFHSVGSGFVLSRKTTERIVEIIELILGSKEFS